MINCVLADDENLLRETLRGVLSLEPNIHVVADANNAKCAMEAALLHRADLIVLDINMPGMSAFDAAKTIHRTQSRMKIMFLTGHADDHYVLRAIDSGASGYFLKSGCIQDLRAAIQSVIRGQKHLPMAARLMGKKLPSSGTHLLTACERDILKMLAEGSSVKDIASILDRSVKTVDNHKSNLMRKLNIHNRAQTVAFAQMHGLVEVVPLYQQHIL